jgi:hypothetical protein
MERYLIITTINNPNKIMKHIAEQAYDNNYKLIIVGDKKTPIDYELDNSIYLPIEKQIEFNSAFSTILPYNHYSRKNIGYLYAMAQFPEYIQETDDDNIPLPDFWKTYVEPKFSIFSEKDIWYNAYSYFVEENSIVWPRGYPLEMIKQSNSLIPVSGINLKTLIYQGLANCNPDVDAIYRLTGSLPIKFLENRSIQLGKKVWCPFNSQNTVFLPDAFPLLYLPSTCSFRMTDIWRSFIAQRCLWEIDGGVEFHSATVEQERNEHSLLRDFSDEITGYLGNEKIKTLLSNCKLTKDDIFKNMQICYMTLIEHKFFDSIEIDILNQWIISCKKIKSIY